MANCDKNDKRVSHHLRLWRNVIVKYINKCRCWLLCYYSSTAEASSSRLDDEPRLTPRGLRSPFPLKGRHSQSLSQQGWQISLRIGYVWVFALSVTYGATSPEVRGYRGSVSLRYPEGTVEWNETEGECVKSNAIAIFTLSQAPSVSLRLPPPSRREALRSLRYPLHKGSYYRRNHKKIKIKIKIKKQIAEIKNIKRYKNKP